MNKFNFLFLLLLCHVNYAQSERSLEDTQAYIVKMINKDGWVENSTKKRLRAEFKGKLLRIVTMNKDFSEALDNGAVYNFTNVYRFKGPIKEPGDVAHLIIWADYLVDLESKRWKKKAFDFEMHNYDEGEQVMIAFQHLNKLLLESKPAVEKF